MTPRRQLLHEALRLSLLAVFAAVPFGLTRLFGSTVDTHPRQAMERDRLRPPGALSDAEAFRSACIGCNLCAEVCPPRCIAFDQSAGPDQNTPFVDPARRGCTLCGKCMEACPSGALQVTDPRAVNMGMAKIDRLTCYPWANTGVCGACVSICPLGERAISFDFAKVYRPVIADGCVGCGLCVEACPHPSLPIRVVAPGTDRAAA